MRVPLLVLSLPLLTACNTGPRTADVVLAVSVSANQIVAGQYDTITVAATNTTDHVVSLSFGTTCHVLPFIRQAGGSVVLPDGGDYICGQMETALQFQPHETQRQTFVWNGSTVFVTEMPTRTLPAGDYEVYAELRAKELQASAVPARVRLE
jgi:hypothetical protein